jgi:hypothetical protein
MPVRDVRGAVVLEDRDWALGSCECARCLGIKRLAIGSFFPGFSGRPFGSRLVCGLSFIASSEGEVGGYIGWESDGNVAEADGNEGLGHWVRVTVTQLGDVEGSAGGNLALRELCRTRKDFPSGMRGTIWRLKILLWNLDASDRVFWNSVFDCGFADPGTEVSRGATIWTLWCLDIHLLRDRLIGRILSVNLISRSFFSHSALRRFVRMRFRSSSNRFVSTSRRNCDNLR